MEKKLHFPQFQKCLNVSERTVTNYVFVLKCNTTVKLILVIMSKRA